MTDVRHIGFSKFEFFYSRKRIRTVSVLLCSSVTMQNFVKIGQKVADCDFWFSRWTSSAILDFQKFKLQEAVRTGRANVHHYTKFYLHFTDKLLRHECHSFSPTSLIYYDRPAYDCSVRLTVLPSVCEERINAMLAKRLFNSCYLFACYAPAYSREEH